MELNGTRVTTLDEHDIAELPSAGHLMTVLVEIEPHSPGTPPHRHSGPVYGFMLDGDMNRLVRLVAVSLGFGLFLLAGRHVLNRNKQGADSDEGAPRP